MGPNDKQQSRADPTGLNPTDHSLSNPSQTAAQTSERAMEATLAELHQMEHLFRDATKRNKQAIEDSSDPLSKLSGRSIMANRSKTAKKAMFAFPIPNCPTDPTSLNSNEISGKGKVGGAQIQNS